ncbi:hypothetical protein GCM10009426_20000 [Rheinheimera tangshanensis]|nr:hypothetical protein GCM10010920_28250 [Rheinheimera tangshanensis]
MVKKQLAITTLSAKNETAYNYIIPEETVYFQSSRQEKYKAHKNKNKQIIDLYAGASS